jgi:hypothetical protein
MTRIEIYDQMREIERRDLDLLAAGGAHPCLFHTLPLHGIMLSHSEHARLFALRLDMLHI